jgi:tetratricopeptide (TPR) repeat protein
VNAPSVSENSGQNDGAAGSESESFSSATELFPAQAFTARGRSMRENATRAFLTQRGRGAEREALSVNARYYDAIGNLDKAIEAYQSLKRATPNDALALNRLGVLYFQTGKYESCATELREATRLRPNGDSFAVLAHCQLALNRAEQARPMYEQALSLKTDPYNVHLTLYSFSFFQGNAEPMQRALAQMNVAGRLRAETTAGKLFEARRFIGARMGQKEQATAASGAMAARMLSAQALVEALTLNDAQAQFGAEAALKADPSSVEAAAVLTFIGKEEGNRRLAEAQKEFPEATLLNAIWIPVAHAGNWIRAGDPARAIELLKGSANYESSPLGTIAIYTRGMAYLKAGNGNEAASEFQKILSRPGVAATTSNSLAILYPLSHLGLGRAYASSRNLPQARKSYQDFFALWKDADSAIPILVQARREFTNLGPGAARGGRAARGQR